MKNFVKLMMGVAMVGVLAGCQQTEPQKTSSANNNSPTSAESTLKVDAAAEASQNTNDAIDAANRAMAEASGVQVKADDSAKSSVELKAEEEIASDAAAMEAANKAMLEAQAKVKNK